MNAIADGVCHVFEEHLGDLVRPCCDDGRGVCRSLVDSGDRVVDQLDENNSPQVLKNKKMLTPVVVSSIRILRPTFSL